LAKTSGWLINLNLSLLLLFQVKSLKKFVFIPFSLKHTHYHFVFYLYIWSLVHVISHYINFYKLINLKSITSSTLFSWGVGFTGHVLLLCLFLFIIFSLPYFKKYKFHSFVVLHYSLISSIILFICLHGTFCFFKPDKKSNLSCFPATSWAWIILPFLLLLSEIIFKYSQKKFKISKVILFKESIYEIHVNLPKHFSGKTIYICSPDISVLEWHPFTISSYNPSTNTCSIIIKIRGNWTKKFSNLLGIHNTSVFPVIFPSIYVDGPYHSLPSNITNILSNKTTLLISAGIGLTTFHDLLLNILNNNIRIKNTHFVIICRKFHEIEWCIQTLYSISCIQNFHLYLFFTKEHMSTNINLPYSIGRPDFQAVFNLLNISHDNSSGISFIFFSGKHSILKFVQKYKRKYISNSKLYEL